MYPLVQLGPFRLSSGGLVLLLAIVVGNWVAGWVAVRWGGMPLAAQVERCFYPILIGAVIGGRLWYGLFNLDVYGRQPEQLWALRFGDWAWPGALVGATLGCWLWGRWRHWDLQTIGDVIALALPFATAIGYIGMLLSGEVFGLPTTLPWGIVLFGAVRHPTQIYFALAALASGIVLWPLARYHVPPGGLFAAYVALQGFSLIVVEVFRADSLVLPGGIRAAQVFGLALMLGAIAWVRTYQDAHGMLCGVGVEE